MGFFSIPKIFQVVISENSSNVPIPPGRIIKASDRSYIFFFLSCILLTIIRSETSLFIISFFDKSLGIIPVTYPPPSRIVLATNPINPILAPP